MSSFTYDLVGLDFETFSEVDLRTTGTGPYFAHPSTRVLMACVRSYAQAWTFDFVEDYQQALSGLAVVLKRSALIAAHNAAFELACLELLGLDEIPLERIIDTAVLTRAFGASSSLAASTKQLLPTAKMEEGKDLIQLFSVPNERNGGKPFSYEELMTFELVGKWMLFQEYCQLDALLSQKLASILPDSYNEERNWQTTHRMNKVGWPVNLYETRRLLEMYEDNCTVLIKEFRRLHDPDEEINLNSPQQLLRWVTVRGVRMTSMDQQAVESTLPKIRERIMQLRNLSTQQDLSVKQTQQLKNYDEVASLLELKHTLGGSSLKKLPVILAQAVPDPENPHRGRLYDQYLHFGAGQTGRTSGRGVQMQNLARAGERTRDLDEVFYDENITGWMSNEEMAQSIRQLFQAPPGRSLLVLDFSAIESRMLAWLAGEQWKLDAFYDRRDLYKVLAAKIKGKDLSEVTKEDRQFGKVGELSCGYGAGAGAVAAFSQKVGYPLTTDASASLVNDWRAVNTDIVKFWSVLDDTLHEALESRQPVRKPLTNHFLTIGPCDTPDSLLAIHPGAQSLQVKLQPAAASSSFSMIRYFHGCYQNGRNISYYRPSDAVNGPGWTARRAATPSAPAGTFNVYGGKLAGILTQSMARELFFDQLNRIEEVLQANYLKHFQAQLIGQFHDEVIIEYTPDGSSTVQLRGEMVKVMTSAPNAAWRGLPLACSLDEGQRYAK